MPSKKKKYNSRFPPARIKKIMQTDDEIGKIAAAVPVLISKCLEMFLSSILTSAGEVTKAKKAKTMSTSHLKECIMNVKMFDFLKDVVVNVPDMQNDEEPSTSAATGQEHKKVNKKRNIANSTVPKKRAKLADSHAVSEDSEINEEVELNDEDKPNGSLAFSSPEQPVKEARSSAASKPSSFHISLDALMSPGAEPSHASVERVYSVPVVEKREGDQRKISDVLADSSAVMERSDSSNGVASPQKAMDLTMNSMANRTSNHGDKSHTVSRILKQESSAKEDVVRPSLHQSAPSTLHPIPTPLNMAHLYTPLAVSSPAFPKNPNAALPQGGMLSFLYSGYPGDTSLPPPPSAVSPSAAGDHKSNAPVQDSIYPYNPVAEHYKRLEPSAVYQHAQEAKTLKPPSKVSTEDDDYDA